MKKNILLNLAAFLAGATLLTSCSTSHQTAFTKAKYYNFGHHNPVVVFNDNTDKTARQSINEPLQNTQATGTNSPAEKAVQTAATEQNSSVQKIERQMHSSPRVAGEPTAKGDTKTGCNEKKEEAYPSYMPVYANQAAPAATASGSGNGSVSPTVLIILAIFLSPLAVYLYDNAATGRFWLDLVLWVLGIGFLGLLLFTGLLWLIAVIYAIIIVTGH